MSRAITYSPAFKNVDAFLRMYGESSMAFSSLQPNLKYYIDNHIGYMPILYMKHPVWAPKGFNVIFGDPICRDSDFNELLQGYLASCQGETTAFIHLSEKNALRLNAMNYQVNQMGVEHMIDLTRFDCKLPGSRFSHVRRWRNKARKEGIVVREQTFDEINPAELQQLNDNWLKSKGGVEFIGLTRPLRLEDKQDVRGFWAYKQNKLVGYALFDPMYRENQVFGYIHNIARLANEAPHGTNDLIILTALEKFSVEGCQQLSLGLSPLAGIEDADFSHSKMISSLLRFMYKYCEFVYPFKGNYFHKQRYRGEQCQTYLAILPSVNIYRLLGVFKTLNLL